MYAVKKATSLRLVEISLTSRSDTDNNALAPTLMTGFEGSTHNTDPITDPINSISTCHWASVERLRIRWYQGSVSVTPSRSDTDNNALAPTLMTGFEGSTHNTDISGTVKGVIASTIRIKLVKLSWLM
jgi:hypothetical protein